MDKLPKVFANPINKKIDNVQELFYQSSERSNESVDPKDLNKKINAIFAAKDHVYKSRVKIILKDKVIEEVIVGKTSVNLLTIDGKLIKISDILNIEKI